MASNHRAISRPNDAQSRLQRFRLANGPSTCYKAPPSSFTDSRSSSKVSSIPSSVSGGGIRQKSAIPSAQPPPNRTRPVPQTTTKAIPDTVAIRRGLAKFSNPTECQRQIQALNTKITYLNDLSESRGQKIQKLLGQLEEAAKMGVGYATVVQYFSKKLKLDSDLDLETECEQLQLKVDQSIAREREYQSKLDTIVDEYRDHLKVEQDLRTDVEKELQVTRDTHQKELADLKNAHNSRLNCLQEEHSTVKEELENRINGLEIELKTKTYDLSELKKEYDLLNDNFNKLEESLTKDKDARVKYAQEKANQLQKDVDSLNSVLEMRIEKIHALEKDSILLGETQQELTIARDQNKALKQQFESLTAALENKRDQYEKLFAEFEQISSDLKKERRERRRMTMRTEQLEYVLNESCANETNANIFDTSARSIESADQTN